jgi:hypothetical protein
LVTLNETQVKQGKDYCFETQCSQRLLLLECFKLITVVLEIISMVHKRQDLRMELFGWTLTTIFIYLLTI